MTNMRFLTLKNSNIKSKYYIGLLGYIITYMGVEIRNTQALINSIPRITIENKGSNVVYPLKIGIYMILSYF